MFGNIRELVELQAMIEGGYVVARRHPSAPLTIYNYTAKAQYDRMWNETTLACRGLICNDAGDVVARPFSKFFNLEQIESLPNESFRVYEKYDGSLGILYWMNGEPFIATRGSFDSEQALRATAMLRAFDTAQLNRDYTYLFEIIYPENRVVVNYGSWCGLVLLAVIETKSGNEMPIHLDGEPVFAQFPTATLLQGVHSVSELKQLKRSNSEGFVVHFSGGARVKVKMDEYVRLHKLLTGISEKMILEEYLMTGVDLKPLLERVPDEFYDWVYEVVQRFIYEFAKIECAASNVLDEAARTCKTRKAYAEAFAQTPYQHILFKMLDGRDYSDLIWRMLKPETKVFRLGVE